MVCEIAELLYIGQLVLAAYLLSVSYDWRDLFSLKAYLTPKMLFNQTYT